MLHGLESKALALRGDRGRYVLGWTNAAKIAALESKAHQLAKRLADSGAHIAALQTQQDAIKARLEALSKLDEYRDFQELDWQSLAAETARLQDEKGQLEAASDILKTLDTRLAELIATRQATEKQLAEHRDKRSKTEQKLADAQSLQAQTRTLLHDPAQGSLSDLFERLEVDRNTAKGCALPWDTGADAQMRARPAGLARQETALRALELAGDWARLLWTETPCYASAPSGSKS